MVSEVLGKSGEQEDLSTDGDEVNTEDELSAGELVQVFEDDHKGLLILRNKHIANTELKEMTLPMNVVFIDCCFEGDFRLLKFSIQGGIWFLNCKFKRNLTLNDGRCRRAERYLKSNSQFCLTLRCNNKHGWYSTL